MDKISWIDANGTETLFSKQKNYEVMEGMNGRFMPSFTYVEEEVPFQDGTVLRQVNVNARSVDLPLYIKGKDSTEVRSIMRQLLRSFNPKNGDGKLKVVSDDGSQRELNCRYNGGLEIQETRTDKGFNWQKMIIILKAFDPYWYDTITKVHTFTSGEPATFFPFFPLRISSSTVFSNATIDNSGDVESYPEWIIKGQCENIVLKNLTSGQKLQLDISLQFGESLIIDTRPNKKSIKKSDGTNLFYTLSDDSSLWSLQEGFNNIQIEMGNTTSESSVQLSYKNRYWSV